MKVTVNHETIKQWAQKFEGRPVIVDDEGLKREFVQLRIDFPRRAGGEQFFSDEVYKISWLQFFHMFEEMQLAFEYEDREKIEDLSLAYRFVRRFNLENGEI